MKAGVVDLYIQRCSGKAIQLSMHIQGTDEEEKLH